MAYAPSRRHRLNISDTDRIDLLNRVRRARSQIAHLLESGPRNVIGDALAKRSALILTKLDAALTYQNTTAMLDPTTGVEIVQAPEATAPLRPDLP